MDNSSTYTQHNTSTNLLRWPRWYRPPSMVQWTASVDWFSYGPITQRVILSMLLYKKTNSQKFWKHTKIYPSSIQICRCESTLFHDHSTQHFSLITVSYLLAVDGKESMVHLATTNT